MLQIATHILYRYFKIFTFFTLQMKTSYAVAALLAGVCAEESKYVLIAEGILKGALEAEGFTDIEKCIQDGEKLVQDAEAAVKDFEQGDAGDVIDGLKKIADAAANDLAKK